MRRMDDTICAVSTAFQPAAIGIVRVSGPGAEDAARRVFVPRKERDQPYPHRRMIVGSLTLPTAPVPDCLLCFFRAPRSYTGEDVCEFHLPGNPLLLAALMEALIACGCRPAEGGEFTRRGWANGKMDLATAELINELARAPTLSGLRIAAGQMGGVLYERFRGLRQRLVDLSAAVDAAIEFGETEGICEERPRMAALVRELLAEHEAALGPGDTWRVLREGCRVAIIGAANVGKSSLFNFLCRSEKAIVHHLPGTTRDVLREVVEFGGITITLHDTAGLRSASGGDEVEAEGMRRSRQLARDSDGVIVVVDGSSLATPADLEALAIGQTVRSVLIINKIDAGTRFQPENSAELPSLSVSLKSGLNCEKLVPMIRKGFGDGDIDQRMLLAHRHREVVMRSACALRAALQDLEEGAGAEVVAEGLRDASSAIGELTGEVRSEEILQRIFAEFCIGK